jgi:hypothetical protein
VDGVPRCRATKADGSPCQARPMPDSDLCAFHDPAVAQRQREGRQRGGRRGSKTLPEDAPDFPLATPGEVRVALGQLVNLTAKGKLDVKVGNCLTYMLATLLRSIEGDELAKRVEVLEQLVQTRRPTL